MTDFPIVNDYDDVARLRGQRPLLYQSFGSYQGEWLCFAVDADNYYVYKDYFGSCSGCDALQDAHFDTPEKVQEFVDGYPAFAEIPRATARNLALAGTLGQTFPANVRTGEVPYDEVVQEATLLIKLEEGLPITVEETLATRNQETRRRVIERDGIADFMGKVNATITHADGEDKLVRFGDGSTYLWLQDASTDREYVLRVPPEMQRVREAKAWTFNVPEQEYAPLIET